MLSYPDFGVDGGREKEKDGSRVKGNIEGTIEGPWRSRFRVELQWRCQDNCGIIVSDQSRGQLTILQILTNKEGKWFRAVGR